MDFDGDFDSLAGDPVELMQSGQEMLSRGMAIRLVGVDRMREAAVAEAIRFGRGSVEIAERSVRLEIATLLRVSEREAGNLVEQAEALGHRYPDVLRSLYAARITARHAQLYVELLGTVEPDLRQQLIRPGLELAETHLVTTFRRKLQRLVDSVRAQTLTERHEEALRQRRVVLEKGEDGMCWYSVYLPSVEGQAIYGRVTRQAKVLAARDGEIRTMDQLRADITGDLLIDGVTSALPAEARGIRPTAVVTVPALSLLDDDAAAHAPAEVEGIGPIPIDRARELCGNAIGWTRVLTHPETGMILSVGRSQYRPPPALRRLVAWRADRCMAPGCTIPASRCQIDHTLAWEHGGHTALDNHAPLCQGHHTIKHHGGWSVEQLPGSGGALLWISPAGRRYIVEPERRVPVFTPKPPPQPQHTPAPF